MKLVWRCSFSSKFDFSVLVMAVESVDVTQTILDWSLMRKCRPRSSTASNVRHGAQCRDIMSMECTKAEANINISQFVWLDQKVETCALERLRRRWRWASLKRCDKQWYTSYQRSYIRGCWYVDGVCSRQLTDISESHATIPGESSYISALALNVDSSTLPPIVSVPMILLTVKKVTIL